MKKLSELFTLCREAAQKVFPFSSDKILSLSHEETSKTGGIPIGYSVIEHSVFYTPEFSAEANRILASKSLTEMFNLASIMCHEITHGSSYRDLEKLDDPKKGKIYSGICIEWVEGREHIVHWDLANEMFTDTYAVSILSESFPQWSAFIENLKNTSLYFLITQQLEYHVGHELVRDAYFNREIKALFKALQEKEIDGRKLFKLIETVQSPETIEYLKKLGIQGKISS